VNAVTQLADQRDAAGKILTLEELGRLFPVFRGDPPKVMAYGTHRGLTTQLTPGYTPSSITRAFKQYTGSPAYLQATRVGAPRFDLLGEAVGTVTVEEEARAMERLEVTAQPLPNGDRPRPHLLTVFCERFPHLFDLRCPKPLPRGTYKQMLKCLGRHYSPNDIAHALRFYCKSDGYQRALEQAAVAKQLGTDPSEEHFEYVGPDCVTGDAMSHRPQLSPQQLARRFPHSFGARPLRPLATSVRQALRDALAPAFTKMSIDRLHRSHRMQPGVLASACGQCASLQPGWPDRRGSVRGRCSAGAPTARRSRCASGVAAPAQKEQTTGALAPAAIAGRDRLRRALPRGIRGHLPPACHGRCRTVHPGDQGAKDGEQGATKDRGGVSCQRAERGGILQRSVRRFEETQGLG